jgi:hypothetical protein
MHLQRSHGHACKVIVMLQHPSPAILYHEQESALQVLWGECISGALYKGDFIRLAQKVGFQDPRSLSSAPIEVTDPELKDIVGNARFSSITYRYSHLHPSSCPCGCVSCKMRCR